MVRVSILLWILVGASIPTGPALARPRGQRAAAKVHFDAAELHYRLGAFRKALAKYVDAYKLFRHPDFLFNIAQCHRHLQQYKKAHFFYKMYLTDKPQASNRVEVQRFVTEMAKKMKTAAPPRRVREATTPPPPRRAEDPTAPPPRRPPGELDKRQLARAKALANTGIGFTVAGAIVAIAGGAATGVGMKKEDDGESADVIILAGSALLGIGGSILVAGTIMWIVGALRYSSLKDEATKSATFAPAPWMRAYDPLHRSSQTGRIFRGAPRIAAGLALPFSF